MTRDFKKQYQWRKEKTVYIGINLNKGTDSDIIDYLDTKQEQGQSKQGLIKEALREKQQREG